MVWKLVRKSIELSMLNLRCEFVHLNRHVPIVFLSNQPITTLGSDYCSILRMDG